MVSTIGAFFVQLPVYAIFMSDEDTGHIHFPSLWGVIGSALVGSILLGFACYALKLLEEERGYRK